jgi:hypothetical protein
MNKKPTIVWDVDDVLNDLMRSWFDDAWLREHPECLVTYRDIRVNPPCQILGTTLQEYLDSLDRFRLSGAFSRLEPVNEVLHWFERCGEEFRHVALTSTPLCAASTSAEWVMRHFGRWIRSFHFIPSKREGEKLPSYDATKLEFLSWLRKGDIFVDDNQAATEAAASMGMYSLLVPQPWNGCMQTLPECLELLTTLTGRIKND